MCLSHVWFKSIPQQEDGSHPYNRAEVGFPSAKIKNADKGWLLVLVSIVMTYLEVNVPLSEADHGLITQLARETSAKVGGVSCSDGSSPS